jgi:catechol 2,3-dioxygenase-like lactoylglutathione lyase family enzyme
MSDSRWMLGAMNAPAPLANLITLGARDLPTLRDFYRALGWPLMMDEPNFSGAARPTCAIRRATTSRSCGPNQTTLSWSQFGAPLGPKGST